VRFPGAGTGFRWTLAFRAGRRFVAPGRRRDLPVALVKVEGRVQLGLAGTWERRLRDFK